MPEFHAEEAERERKKTAMLAPYIEAAFRRKKYLAPLADELIPEYPAYGFSIAEAKSPVGVD